MAGITSALHKYFPLSRGVINFVTICNKATGSIILLFCGEDRAAGIFYSVACQQVCNLILHADPGIDLYPESAFVCVLLELCLNLLLRKAY